MDSCGRAIQNSPERGAARCLAMALRTTIVVEFDGPITHELSQEFQDRVNAILEEAFSHELEDLGVFDYEVTYETE